jgi:beta-lactamase regulating signal transducer with metallopeptidase domain
MLIALFNRVVELSFVGSIVAGLILLTKCIFKDKLTPRGHYFIWFILIVKLLMPIDVESALGMMPSIEVQTPIYQTFPKTIENEGRGVEGAKDTWMIANEVQALSTSKVDAFWIASPVLSTIWACIVLILILFNIYGEWQFNKKQGTLIELYNPTINRLRKKLIKRIGLTKKVKIYIQKTSGVPKVYGVIAPKIIISEDLLYSLNLVEFEHVLLHELCHIKQKDIIINVLRKLLMCVYFFNPFLVWCLKRMARECESACDEMVLKHLNPEEHLQYGYTLISLVQHKTHRTQSLALSLGRKKDMIRRIEMINKYTHVTLKSKVMSLALMGLLAGTCLFVPHATAEERHESTQEEYTLIEGLEGITHDNENSDTETLVFIKPLEKGTITSYYGNRTFGSEVFFHDGVDIAAPMGEKIFASESGKVVYIDLNESEYGKLVVIEHAGGIKTLYAQCEEILVAVDDVVEKGDNIATVGTSGRSTGPHLHLALLKENETINPETMMDWIVE